MKHLIPTCIGVTYFIVILSIRLGFKYCQNDMRPLVPRFAVSVSTVLYWAYCTILTLDIPHHLISYHISTL